MNALAPCPFCKKENARLDCDDSYYFAGYHWENEKPYSVVCRECGGRGPCAADEETARREWNQATVRVSYNNRGA